MGFIREPVGRIELEERRESFIIHPEGEDEGRDREFLYLSLPDLIEALIQVRDDPHGRYQLWKEREVEGELARAHPDPDA